MESFKEHTDALASLDTFAPDVFVGDEEVSQDVCNFVLSLALIWNDYKDATYAHALLKTCEPQDPPGPTREWGAYGGIDLHLFRYQVTLMRELLTLVCRNQAVARGDYIDGIVRRFPRARRDGWHSTVQVALGSVPTDEFGQCLIAVRNKLSHHYDPRAIEKGYRNHFFGEGREDDSAFISSGRDMRATRFYFADAAAFGYLQEIPGGGNWDRLSADARGVMAKLGDALMGVVAGFVDRRTDRGGPFDEEETPDGAALSREPEARAMAVASSDRETHEEALE